MQSLEILHVTKHYAQQIVGISGHQITFLNLRDISHCSFKGGQHLPILSLQRDIDVCGAFKSCSGLIKNEMIACNQTAFDEQVDPPEACRWRKMNALRERDVAQGSVLLQQLKDTAIEFVGLWRRSHNVH